MSLTPAPDFDAGILAGVLGALAADTTGFVDALAGRLDAALPGRVEVDRTGLFGRGAVRRLAVDVGEHRFEVGHDRGRLTTRVGTAVRGVVIRTDDLPVERWIDDLSAALAAEADSNVAVRAALGAAFL